MNKSIEDQIVDNNIESLADGSQRISELIQSNEDKFLQVLVDNIFGPDNFVVLNVKKHDGNHFLFRVESLEDGMVEIFDVSLTSLGFAKNKDTSDFEVSK